jgi:hypothetical protein
VQEATAARQQKQIEALTAGLQKMSAQLQLNPHRKRLSIIAKTCQPTEVMSRRALAHGGFLLLRRNVHLSLKPPACSRVSITLPGVRKRAARHDVTG